MANDPQRPIRAVAPPPDGRPGAVAAPRKRGLPPWLIALLALLAVAALMLLIVLLARRGSDSKAGPAASASSSPQPSSAAASSAPSTSAPTSAAGQLTSNGQSLFPANGAVSPQAGQPATGTSVGVVELAGAPAAGSAALDDERFFVGDATHETLVFLHINAEPPFEISAGRQYTFTGTVRQYTDAAVSALTDAAKAKVSNAGYYIEITDVSQIHAG